MINRFSFVHNDVLIPVLIAGLVLFAIFFYKEWVTRNRRNFVLNAVVAFVTIAALVLLVLEPTKEVEVDDQKGLLLTDGFDEQQNDSLVSLNKGIKVLNYDSGKSIRNELDSLTSIYVIGQGIPSYDFSLFNDLSVDYIPKENPSGINRLSYTNHINLGEKVEIVGSYNQPIKGAFLVFEDSGGNGLDSIQFGENGNPDFSLSGSPKTSGTYVYQLTVKDSTGVLLDGNPLPIEIKEKKPLRVLILNNFPTFETKYLKNFLAEEGHEVIVRSQLTKGKFKFEYFNTSSSPVYELTDAVLNQFDLIISDADTYFNFSASLKNRFEKNIRESGLGVFIQPSEFLFNLRESSSYFKFKRDAIDEVQLPNSSNSLEKYPYDFDEQFLVQPILKGDGLTIAAYKQMGLGRVATTTISNSYQLLLNGSDEAYKNCWTQILDAIIKKNNMAVEWKAVSHIPIVDAPFDFNLYTNLKGFSIVNENGGLVATVQKPMISNKYSGIIYPKKKGWNTLEIESDSTSQFSYYVYDDVNWKSLRTTESIAANQKRFKNTLNKNRTVTNDRPISPISFYILFLIGIGWLWLSPKLITDK
ncbi:hypothetical protein SAMN04488008_101227 [Maribacter orientalis]|uniref:Uncharacterized protein n=1 Tax=Maribacter orientalis TaxID=228957 RepID=A0A1H7G2W1_9FLAO|nr:hypothetical protein [Maribacter orientalis]SEK30025.1 hypothetical protein SAMN04488008_101227 [Maribacter orientalis]